MSKEIPEMFYKQDIARPTADTVGGLISVLKLLPNDLPIRQRFNSPAVLTVFNMSTNPELFIGDED
jgi:hypothetical protein